MNTQGGTGAGEASPRVVAVDKRAGRRTAADVEIRVEGGAEAYSGQAIDLSPTGTLLWITDERFLPAGDAGNMVAFTERVTQEFSETMRIHFPGCVVRDADIARVTRMTGETGPLLVACEFAESLIEDDWLAMGLEPAAPVRTPGREEPKPSTPVPVPPRKNGNGPPAGIRERRRHARTDGILYLDVRGDQGSYQAYALNVSRTGALITICDPEFAPPSEPDQLVRFTKHLGIQFRNGMIVCFLESDVTAQADVVRVAERTEGGDLMVTIGIRFRAMMTREQCERLGVHAGAEDLTAASPDANPYAHVAVGGQTRILDLMKDAVRLGASDLHVKVASPPRLRIHGSLMDVGTQVISPEESFSMARELMSPALTRRFEADGDVEFAYNIDELGRFRISAFKQRGFTGLAIRTIPSHVPTLEELGLPDVCRRLADRPRGLVLVTGPTGSGKSHTLAAMVNHINQTRGCHILTMEDPIEFIHTDVRAHITQREIGRDCIDFASALKRALRMDPDVILIGEMRDLETTSLALTAAETGHLVFATLHTTSAVNTPDRIVDVFPPNQQVQIRQQLSDSLAGILAQLLVPRVNEGLVLAQEIVVATEAARSLIRESKTHQLRNIVQTGAQEGMVTLETSLNELLKQGLITHETAVAKANYPKQIVEPEPPRRGPRAMPGKGQRGGRPR